MGTSDESISLIGKRVKAVFTDKDKSGKDQIKVVYGELLKDTEFTYEIRDQYGEMVVVGKRNLIVLTERREP